MKQHVRRTSRGFTLIELIVVVAVIGILAAITSFGFGRFQEDSRDAQRTAQVTSIAESLEKYFEENGEYPGCQQLSGDASTLESVLPSLDPAVLKAPADTTSATNSLRCEELTLAGGDFFEYVGDGSQTCLTGNSCITYTLRYKAESQDTIAEKDSRRNSNVATSGAPTLTSDSVSFTRINVSWTSVPNAAGYTLQYATNSSFTGASEIPSIDANTYEITGLSDGTDYWVRVQGTFINDVGGSWSNTLAVTTDVLDASALVATANSESQITVDWGDIVGAATYNLRQATALTGGGELSSPTVFSGLTSSISVRTGLSTGVEYFYQVQGVSSGGILGPWSNIDSATTFVPAPASITATANSSTQITINWAAVSVATSYTLQRSTSSSFTSPTTVAGLTDTSSVQSGLTQGERFYYRVYALVGATSSVASPTADATTSITTPSAPTMNAYTPGTVRAYSAGYWVSFTGSPQSGNWYYSYGTASRSCPTGSSTQYRFQAQYSSPTTLYGWTSWGSASTWYMIRPYSPYKVKFISQARCVGSDATSAASSSSERCASHTSNNVSCF